MNSMNENENVPFDSIPQLHTGSFLTKEQAEQFKEAFKNLTVVVRCKDCKHRGTYDCPVYVGGDGMCSEPDDWFCADGKRK